MFSNLGVKVSKAATDAIEISTVNQLRGMATTGSYKLTADLDLLNVPWTIKEFNGTLDGNGHTIKNVRLSDDSSTNRTRGLALFYSTKGVQVSNLTVENISTVWDGSAYNSYQYIAGLFTTIGSYSKSEYATTPTSLSNITIKNMNVTGMGRGEVAGVVGEIYSGDIVPSLNNIVVDGLHVSGNSGVGSVSGVAYRIQETRKYVSITNLLTNIDVDQPTMGAVAGAISSIQISSAGSIVDTIATFGKANAGQGYGVIGGISGTNSSYHPTAQYITSDIDFNLSHKDGGAGLIGTAGGMVSFEGKATTISNGLFTGSINITGVKDNWSKTSGGLTRNFESNYVTKSAMMAKELNGDNIYNVTGNETNTNAFNKVAVLDSVGGTYLNNTSTALSIADADKYKASTYANTLGWDMNFTWGIQEGKSYPYLVALNELYPNYYSQMDTDAPKLPDLTAPTNLKSDEVKHDEINLSWDVVDGATEYDIVRDGEVIDTVTTNSYKNAPVQADTTYTYQIVAKDTANGREATSEELEVKSALKPLQTPNDIASSNLTPTSVKITWSPVDEATGYKIERNGEVIDTIEGTSFEDTDLIQNTTYKYTVYAVDANRTSEPTSTEVRTPFKDLKAPSGLSTSNVTTSGLTLSWDAVEEADKYRIFQDGVELGIVSGTSIDINSLTPNTKYKFEVQSMDTVNDRESSKSSIEELTANDPLLSPENLKAETVTNTSVLLGWDEVEGATAYKVTRDGKTIATVYTNAYEDTRLTADTDYKYTVTAINEDDGRKSEPTTLDVTTKMSPLASPTNVNATNIDDHSTILSWTAVDGAKSYNIIKNGQVIDTTSGTSYYVGGLEADTVHTLYVQAVDVDTERESGTTPVTFKTVKSPLAIPQNVRAVAGNKSVALTWDKVEGATTYKIFKDGKLVEETNKLAFTDNDVTSSTAYEYQVVAVDSINNLQSNPATVYVKTTIGDIDTFEAHNITSHSIDFLWGMVNGATSYLLERDGVVITETSDLNYTDNSVLKNTSYTYRLYAIDAVTGQKSLFKELLVKTLPEAPTKPENFALYGTPSSDNVVLNWDAVEDADKYTVKRDGEVVYEGTQNSYREQDELPDGKTYIYEVTATNVVGTSEPALLSVEIETVKPDAPANLKVTKSTDNSITVTWDKVLGAYDYTVSLNGEDIETIEGTTYTFSGLNANTTYTLAVSAYNEKGFSDPTSLEAKTTEAPPSKVQNFKPTRITATTINLQWDKLDTATEYEVYRDGTVLVYSGPLSTFSDTTVSPETAYEYTVYGKNQYGKSAEGATILVTTPQEAPPITTTTPDTTSYNVTFDFKVVEGVSTYKVSRNPEWTYTENEDGTYDLNSVNSVTGEEQVLGTVEVTEDGYLPFYEALTGGEGTDLKYNIVGVYQNANGEEVTTDPIEVDVTVPEASENPADVSALSDLKVNGGELKPALTSDKTDYSVEVAEGTKQITIAPTATDKNATITVNGIPVASGGTSPIIDTTTLPQEVKIVVTAEDRVTTTTYTLTVDVAKEEPTNPTDPSEPTDPTDPSEGEDNGDNGTTEPTDPSSPSDGDNGETEQPVDPSNPSDGEDNGGEETPTTPDNGNGNDNGSDNGNDNDSENGDNNGSNEENNGGSDEGTGTGSNNETDKGSDSDKATDNDKQNNEDSKSDDKSTNESKDESKSDKATDNQSKEDAKSGNSLPNTANNFYNYMVAGLVLIAVGVFFIFFTKRRKQEN